MENKQPEIRFPGFTDDWEQRKLSEVSSSYSGGTPSAGEKSYYGGAIPFIRSAEINSDRTELFLTKEGLNTSSAKRVEIGDILYALYGATSGEVGISQINGAINQAILAIKPIEGYNSQFIMQWLRLQKQKIIDKYLQGGQGNLSGSIVKDLQIKFPNYVEQVQVGTFFKQLDDTIVLHQQELATLKQSKQGFLQKMFPKEGAKVPEVRLPGFTNDWERRKLGELLTEKKRPIKIENDKNYQLVTVKRRNGGVVSRGILNGKDILVKNYFELKLGDYIISKRQVVHGATGMVPNELDGAVVSNEYLVSVGNTNSTTNFLTLISKLPQMYKMFFLSSYGIDIEKLVFNVEDWKKRTIYIPSLEEQKKISLFFETLDQTIALHQRELELLQATKKAFLQKLFV